jgi:hypothetical protein
MGHTLNAHGQPPNSPPHLELILGSLFLTGEKFPKKRNRKTRGKKRFLRLSILNPPRCEKNKNIKNHQISIYLVFSV